jgi:hypothetical protein
MLEGVCRAEMDEAAEAPDEAEEAMDCGLAVDRPAIGSALEAGHILRVVRRFGSQLPCTAPLAPLLCADAADMVEFDEEAEEIELRDEEELVRWACLRGRSMRETSSALMPFILLGGPSGAFHPALLLREWKLGGGATAVICSGGQER